MRFTGTELKIFERFAENGTKVCVRGVNCFGQEFVTTGKIVCDNREYYGDDSALTDFRITLDVGQVETYAQPMKFFGFKKVSTGKSINAPLYTEPDMDEDRTLFVLDIVTDRGMFVWKNLQEEALNKFVNENRRRQQGEFRNSFMSDRTKKLVELIGKPCKVYGRNAILTAVREFHTEMGIERYIDCITKDDEATMVHVTSDAVKLDKDAVKRVPPVDDAESYFE